MPASGFTLLYGVLYGGAAGKRRGRASRSILQPKNTAKPWRQSGHDVSAQNPDGQHHDQPLQRLPLGFDETRLARQIEPGGE